jgi:hypothetical protein
MNDGTVRATSESTEQADGQQDDSASALVDVIMRQRELERTGGTGKAVSSYGAVYAELADRGDTDVINVSDARGDASGAQPAGNNDSRRREAGSATGSATGQGSTAAAADALLTVFAIDEEQWTKLLADLPLDTLSELLGHAFRLYQRVAVEEMKRRFEEDSVGPLEPSPFRSVPGSSGRK